MKSEILKWSMVALLSVFSTPGLAYKATLDFEGKLFKGEHVIPLKQNLRQHYPQLKLRQQRLKSLFVIAKSRSNNGTVRLRVGDHVTKKTTVFGRSYNFKGRQAYSFDGVRINNVFKQGHDGRGRWQLLISGELKIQTIVLEMEKKRAHHHPKPTQGAWASVGYFKSGKHGADKRAVVIGKNVNELQIKATKRGSVIEKAYLEMKSGFTLRLPTLEGRLGEGEVKNARLKGWRDVKRLTLVMRSGRWGKRSYVQLFVHKQ